MGNGSLVVSVDEAAKKLGISRSLAYELVQRGVLPCIHLGRRIVISSRKLAELVEDDDQPPRVTLPHGKRGSQGSEKSAIRLEAAPLRRVRGSGMARAIEKA